VTAEENLLAPFGGSALELIAAVARRGSDTVAIEAEDGALITYGELMRLVARAAEDLKDRGVLPGDRVPVIFENCWAVVGLILAIIKVKAWAVPLNARLSNGEIDAILAHCDPRLVFYEIDHSKAAADHAEGRMASRDDAFPLPGFSVVDRSEAQPVSAYCENDEKAEDVALLIYTSGSTGKPKGMMLTHGNIGFIMLAGATQKWFVPGDKIYAALPMSHAYGLMSVAMSALAAGATLFPVARFAAEHAVNLIREGALTAFLGVPTMYARLLEYCTGKGVALRPNRLRLSVVGAAATDAGHKLAYENLLGLKLSNGYGLTEAAPTVSRTRAEEPRADLSAGRPLPGVSVEIRDPASGTRLRAGETGILHVRGPNVMLGYFRDRAATAAVIDRDGWLDTGDLAQILADGHLKVVGRIKELIIRSGFNVYPLEVEAALCAHPAVEAAAVLGRSVPGNEEVLAFVQPRIGQVLDADELSAFVADRLAAYKRPSIIHLRKELPLTSTGKISKMALRQEIAAGSPNQDRD
jgi:long-chain acyl-CoA synthetase